MSQGLKFNGIDLSNVLDVNPTRRLGLPTEDYTEVVPGANGETFVRKRLKPLTIPLKVRLKLADMPPQDVARQRRRVVAALTTEGLAKLVVPDEPTLYYMATLNNPEELDTLWRNGGTTLEFVAYDPVAFGERKKKMLVAGDTYLMVKGTAPTRPTLNLTASGGRVRVENLATGLYVALLEDVSKGAAVTIDMLDQFTTVDGEPVPVELGSDYFDIEPGRQRVSLGGADGVIEWDERWY